MVAALDPLSRAQADDVDDSNRSGEKRKRNGLKLKKYHSPWDTIPVHCIDLVSGRSAIDDKSPEAIWEYLKQGTPILEWRSECPHDCFWWHRFRLHCIRVRW